MILCPLDLETLGLLSKYLKGFQRGCQRRVDHFVLGQFALNYDSGRAGLVTGTRRVHSDLLRHGYDITRLVPAVKEGVCGQMECGTRKIRCSRQGRFVGKTGRFASTPGAKPSDSQLMVSGKAIRRGEHTSVDIRSDPQDTNEILASIRQARGQADIVIVSLHSHEPSNQSELPADFVRQFARSAIDAGASLVIGHGPHQLRGIEVYKNGVIFYSLGNFAFEFSGVDPRFEDAFEGSFDLYRLAMGAISDSEAPPHQSIDSPAWWQSAIVIATYEHSALRSIKLQPIDLGVDLPAAERGLPRLANPQRSREILEKLADLSRAFGTSLRREKNVGFIEIPAAQGH